MVALVGMEQQVAELLEPNPEAAAAALLAAHLDLAALAKSSSLSSLHKELNYDNLCSNRKRN
jgi:hypothetical protein